MLSSADRGAVIAIDGREASRRRHSIAIVCRPAMLIRPRSTPIASREMFEGLILMARRFAPDRERRITDEAHPICADRCGIGVRRSDLRLDDKPIAFDLRDWTLTIRDGVTYLSTNRPTAHFTSPASRDRNSAGNGSRSIEAGDDERRIGRNRRDMRRSG